MNLNFKNDNKGELPSNKGQSMARDAAYDKYKKVALSDTLMGMLIHTVNCRYESLVNGKKLSMIDRIGMGVTARLVQEFARDGS